MWSSQSTGEARLKSHIRSTASLAFLRGCSPCSSQEGMEIRALAIPAPFGAEGAGRVHTPEQEGVVSSEKQHKNISVHTGVAPTAQGQWFGVFSKASAKVLEMTFQPPPGFFLAQSSEAPGTCKNKNPSLFLEGTKISGRVNLERPLEMVFLGKYFPFLRFLV